MNILLIEDHKILADSLKDSLEKTNEINVLVLKELHELEFKIKSEDLDLILMDINLKGLTKEEEQGLEISERLIKNILT